MQAHFPTVHSRQTETHSQMIRGQCHDAAMSSEGIREYLVSFHSPSGFHRRMWVQSAAAIAPQMGDTVLLTPIANEEQPMIAGVVGRTVDEVVGPSEMENAQIRLAAGQQITVVDANGNAMVSLQMEGGRLTAQLHSEDIDLASDGKVRLDLGEMEIATRHGDITLLGGGNDVVLKGAFVRLN